MHVATISSWLWCLQLERCPNVVLSPSTVSSRGNFVGLATESHALHVIGCACGA